MAIVKNDCKNNYENNNYKLYKKAAIL